MIKKLLPNKLLLFITAFAFVTAVTNVSAGQKNDKVNVPVAETIIIDGCDSGIADQTLENGSLMSNLIANCAEGAKNHGAFVSCVAQLTNAWKKDGLIDGQAKGAIQRCAASADIPPASDKKCKEDADCDDGLYCNGVETCIDKACQPGIPIECPDDGLFCNGVESCDEGSDSCMSSGDPCIPPSVCNEDFDICGCGSDADCDDGVFCNGPEACAGGECQPGTPVDCPDNGLFCDGTEYCDENGDACASSGDPCDAPYSCDEPSQSCILIECGNGILEPGEDCDDGNVLAGDCCNAMCQFEAAESPCPDGVYCNGAEICNGEGVCLSGTPIDCSDGILCTIDSCNEESDGCDNMPDNAACDDLQFCNGIEVCNPSAGCQPGAPVDCPDNGVFCDGTEYCDENGDICASGGDPCGAGNVCNEDTDTCDPVVICTCGDGVICGDEQCDDGNSIDGDCCSAQCILDAAGSPCLDDIYCNGAETCDGAGICRPGTPVICDDGVACTTDACNETADGCDYIPDDAYCSDGQYCNGREACDPLLGCQPGTPVDCPDNGLFCDGAEFCDENGDACASSGDPCGEKYVCNEESDVCEPVVICTCGDGVLCGEEQCDDGNTSDGDCCGANCTFDAPGSPCPDSVFCNGDETCDGAGICLPGAPVVCDDGVACTADACNEDADGCGNVPDNNACDDFQFCNGIEVCDPAAGCLPGMPVECPDNGVFCDGAEYCDENGDACAGSGDPCEAGETCDEETDACNPAVLCECGDGVLCGEEQCDDGNIISGDCCSENCVLDVPGSPCPDGIYCNGYETCDGAGTCLPGAPVVCDDGVACTVDACDETADTCAYDPDNDSCSDGLYCNGSELCDPALGCQPGTPVDCPDNGTFCDGRESCDEDSDACGNSGNPCGEGYTCDEDADACLLQGLATIKRMFLIWQQGQ